MTSFLKLQDNKKDCTDDNKPEDKVKDDGSDAEDEADYPAEDEKTCDDGNDIEVFCCKCLSKKSVANVEDAEDEGDVKELSKSPTYEL